MSQPQYGNDMDRMTSGDIIRRARERAQAGLPREDYDTFVRRQQMNSDRGSPESSQNSYPRGGSPESIPPRRLQAPPGLHAADGRIGLPISRPAQVPQWPLAGPLAQPSTPSNQEPYRPPPGSSPPQRPPRPSHVPSLLDASKLQDPTPSFQYQQQEDKRDSEYGSSSVPQTPSTLSRPSTLSSVASIPDFPLPIQAPPPPVMPPPRRTVTLGPPPSARRGASAFYSHLSFVSPIPEESPRSRSHTSYASSAAMPEGWNTPSPAQSRYAEVFYDDVSEADDAPSPSLSVQSIHYDDEGDESRLVRSASVGRRGKAALVTTLTPTSAGRDSQISPHRPAAVPVQPGGVFSDGTGFLETSTNSSNTVRTRNSSMAAPSSEEVMFAFDTSTMKNVGNRRASEPSSFVEADARYSRGFSRLSAIRRPPRLDIDAVRQEQARGSLTSLPDLIRRATRLAASLDRGRRPASRFDMEDFPPEMYAANNSKLANVETPDSDEYYDDKRQSGLSGMLAAFPPPAQAASRNGVRQSLRDSVLSWPLPPLMGTNSRGTPLRDQLQQDGYPSERSTPENEKRGRRCCGLPLWGFVLIIIVIVILIAAAVIIPIEFFVLRRNNQATSATAAADSQCQNQLTCLNGGTNVVTNDICSCICSNGFTGFDCSTSGAAGCTTTTVSGATNNITNATLGDAIPRLLAQASTNFAVTLSDTAILAKLNTGNLSCTSQNALVTFNGDDASASTSSLSTASAAFALSDTALAISDELKQAEVVNNVAIATLTIMAGQSATITLTIDASASTEPTTTVTITRTMTSDFVPPAATTTASNSPVPQVTASTSASTSAATPAATGAFAVSDQVLDFARVGVLFVLQTDSLTEATVAQSTLQSFFTSVTAGDATSAEASNLTLSNGNSIDLVNFRVDAGTGLVGSLVTTGTSKRGVGAGDAGFVDLWAWE